MQWRLDPGQLEECDYDADPRELAPVFMSPPTVPVSPDEYGALVKNFAKLGMCVTVGAFHDTGGQERFNTWADQNYGEFATKFLTKTLPKQVQLEHSGSVSIDDMLLGLGDADAIDGEFREVEGA